MTLTRSFVAALMVFGAACSSSPDNHSRTGGTQGTGGANATGGQPGTGGASATGGHVGTGGSPSSGGTPGSGGSSAGTGGSLGTGGTLSGGQSGTVAAGGSTGRDAGAATGGSGGGTTKPIDAGGGSGDPVPSAGCGKTPTLAKSVPPPNTKMNYINIQSGGGARKYLLWYPDNYDNNHPYRLIFAYHWLSGSASQVFDCNTEGIKCYTTQSPFYGLLNLADNSTIFIAPDGLNAGWGNTNGQDLTFTDDMIKQVENDLCIDKSRIFANGFSYGGGMSYAIACARADVFRAVAVYDGGQLSGCTGGKQPIAYYGSHGVDDGTLSYSGGLGMMKNFATNNGCTWAQPPQPSTGQAHICTSLEGCSAGHPTRWCAFIGSNKHDPSPKDPGQSGTWNPAEVWKFITQF